MPIKILSKGSDTPYQPGIGERIAAVGKKGLQAQIFTGPSTRGLKSAGVIGDIGGPALSDILQSQVNISEEANNPEGLIESGVHRFAKSAAPSAVLGALGGGLPAALESLITTGLGSAAATGAKALGASEGVQDLTQLGTELGRGLYKGRIDTKRGAQKKAYETTRELAGEAAQEIGPIQDALLNVERNITKFAPTEKIEKAVRHSIEKIHNNIGQLDNKIKVKDALDLRRSLNQSFKSIPEEAKPYVTQLRDSINDFFGSYAAANPKFFNSLTKADQLTEMIHMKSILENGANKIFSNVLPTIIKGVPLGKIIGESASKLLGNTIGLSDKFVRNVIKNPTAREYYLNAVTSIAKEDPVSLIKNLENLKKLFPKEFEEQQPKSRIKILNKGG